MHSQPSSWNSFLTKLGFGRKQRRASRKTTYRRHLRFEQCEDRRMLAVITVNSLLDNGDGANTTLRKAILQANDSLDPARSNSPPASTTPRSCSMWAWASSFIADSVTIDASMLSSLTIDANDPDRMFAQYGLELNVVS